MASGLMLSDNNKMNKINPTSWTGDFGVFRDGFPKNLQVDGIAYRTAMDETPTEYPDIPEGGDNPNMNNSGAMYVKTAGANPAPFNPFPSRKFEYSDGTVTWYRPGMPWNWIGNKSNFDDGYTKKLKGRGDDTTLMILAVIALGLFLVSKKMKF
jgi:hypothetical protein